MSADEIKQNAGAERKPTEECHASIRLSAVLSAITVFVVIVFAILVWQLL